MLARGHLGRNLLLALGAALATACGDGAVEEGVGEGVAEAPGVVNEQVVMTPPAILGVLSTYDNAIVAEAQIAQEKANSPAVREFARNLQVEGSSNARETGQTAERLDIEPVEPPGDQINVVHERWLTLLQQTPTGVPFDTLFLKAMIELNQTALDRFNTALSEADAATIGTLVNQHREKAAANLARAQDLLGTIGLGPGQ